MKNKIIFVGLLALLLVGCVSAVSVNYYYNPQCGHCKQITPSIQQLANNYKNVNWNILDTSRGSYAIDGTPSLILNTDDEREIKIIGSYEIPRYLECELNEQSNLNCPTYSAYQGYSCETNSWFIRE